MRREIAGLAWLGVALGGRAAAQFTQRVSLDAYGAQAGSDSFSPSISSDGRYVAFSTGAALVPNDTNQRRDVYLRDRETKTTTRVSVTATGGQAGADSAIPSISADGRYIAFLSLAPNLVAADTNEEWDVFVRDRQTGQTRRVSVDSSGAQADGASGTPSISADGRHVAFWSRATGLVSGDTNGFADVFVHDLATGTTTRVSVATSGAEGNSDSLLCSISGDGRYVAFGSMASNLVAGDTNAAEDVFVRDLAAGTTTRVSVDPAGAEAAGGGGAPAISSDGGYVAFLSEAPNLVPGDTNARPDVFVRDLVLGITTRASVGSAGAQSDGSILGTSISGDGRYVAFVSTAATLVPGDTNGPLRADVFLHDNASGVTTRVNLGPSNVQDSGGVDVCAISADGGCLAFDSAGTNLVPADTNESRDVFVRDLYRGTGFTSVCDPGLGGVLPCPCGNAPAGAGRGCDNSSSTGGAILAATGGAFVSEDTLAFTTTGERPTAASFLLEGTSTIASGAVYGQGVRCLTGALRRLYNQAASAGSITVPDVEAFEPPVSVRSALLGSPIQAGETRWYLVAYRDPVALGGCPAISTFNATQTGRVIWSP